MDEAEQFGVVGVSFSVILLFVAARGRQCLIDNGRTLVGFLSLCCTQEPLQEEGIREGEKCQCIDLHHL